MQDGPHAGRRPAGPPLERRRANPPAVLHTRHHDSHRHSRGQEHIMNQRPVLPPAFQQLTLDKQRHPVTNVGNHQFADRRTVGTFGYVHVGRPSCDQPGGRRGARPDREHRQWPRPRTPPYVQFRHLHRHTATMPLTQSEQKLRQPGGSAGSFRAWSRGGRRRWPRPGGRHDLPAAGRGQPPTCCGVGNGDVAGNGFGAGLA